MQNHVHCMDSVSAASGDPGDELRWDREDTSVSGCLQWSGLSLQWEDASQDVRVSWRPSGTPCVWRAMATEGPAVRGSRHGAL